MLGAENFLWGITFFLLGIEFYSWAWEFIVGYRFTTDVKHGTFEVKKDTCMFDMVYSLDRFTVEIDLCAVYHTRYTYEYGEIVMVCSSCDTGISIIVY